LYYSSTIYFNNNKENYSFVDGDGDGDGDDIIYDRREIENEMEISLFAV
jgi:hypothetical protein